MPISDIHTTKKSVNAGDSNLLHHGTKLFVRTRKPIKGDPIKRDVDVAEQRPPPSIYYFRSPWRPRAAWFPTYPFLFGPWREQINVKAVLSFREASLHANCLRTSDRIVTPTKSLDNHTQVMFPVGLPSGVFWMVLFWMPPRFESAMSANMPHFQALISGVYSGIYSQTQHFCIHS